jgi:hypothetical protein
MIVRLAPMSRMSPSELLASLILGFASRKQVRSELDRRRNRRHYRKAA